MAGFRRTALTSGAVLILLVAVSRAGVAETDITLDAPKGPGSLRITNHGRAAVRIAHDVVVEHQTITGWTAVPTDFAVVTACPIPPGADPVDLKGGDALEVITWSGNTCSAQCRAACRANIYVGPGTFRFSVSIVGGTLVAGPAFDLPTHHQ